MTIFNASSTALASNRQLGITNTKLTESMKRLSTGLKINKASDSPAHLNLTKQIDTQISDSQNFQKNAQDAISLLNTLDGDMTEIQNNLNRLRELSLQGMNGVYTSEELANLQSEITQVAQNIEQITKNSSFGEKKLLDGTTSSLQVNVSSDYSTSLSAINLSSLTEELDFVDVITGKEDIYFLNMTAGSTYYAEFDDRLYELTNTSGEKKNLIYRYEEDLGNLDNSIEFIKDFDGITVSLYGEYENDQVQLGNGESYLNIAAGATEHVRVGDNVYNLTNTTGVDNIAVFETSGTSIDILSGDGITGNYEYTISSYNSLSGNECALDFADGETKHIEFAGRLYELTNNSSGSQTAIFRNSGYLNQIAGFDEITVTNLGSMTNETILNGTQRYVELSADQAQYYEEGGIIHKLTNNTSETQTAILSSNTLLNTTGTVTKSAYTETVPTNVNSSDVYLELSAGETKQLTDGSNIYSYTNTSGVDQVALINSSFNLTSSNGNINRSVTSVNSADGNTSGMANPYALNVTSGQTYYLKSDDDSKIYELTATESGVAVIDFDGNTISSTRGANLNQTLTSTPEFEDVTPDGLNQFTIDLSSNSTELITINDEVYEIDNTGNGAQSATYYYDSVGKTVTDANTFGMTNPYSLDVTSGETYYLKSSDNSKIYELNATETGTAYLDFDGNNIISKTGANLTQSTISNPEFENITPDGLNQFTVDLSDNTTEMITINGEVYELDNTGNGAQSVSYQYDSVGKTLTDISLGTTTGSYQKDLSSLTSETTAPSGNHEANYITLSNNVESDDIYVENFTSGSSMYLSAGSDIFLVENTGATQGFVFDYDSGSHTLTSQNGGSINATLFNNDTTSNGLDYRLELNANETKYIEMGSDIFTIKNNQGTKQTLLFDYSSGSLVTNSNADVTIEKPAVSSFGNVDSGDIMLNLGNGSTQHITIGGDTFSIENNLGANQTVLLNYSSGNLNIDSGSSLNISKHNDMANPTNLSSSDFYVDLNAVATEYIEVNNRFFKVDNTTSDSKIGIFSRLGNDLIPKATSDINDTFMSDETNETLSASNEYYVELDPNEQKWIKQGGFAFELNNAEGVSQTELFTTSSNSMSSLNNDVSEFNVGLSNLSNFNQLLVKVDWSMEVMAKKRAELGAKTNSLESAIERNQAREHNLSATNSLLRDTNVAKETANFTKQQILQQASSAVLANSRNMNKDISMVLLGLSR